MQKSTDEARPAEPAISVQDHIAVDYVFDTDLVIDGPRRRTVVAVDSVPHLHADARPQLRLGTRFYRDEGGAVHLVLPLGEPGFTQHPRVLLVQRTRREVVVRDSSLLWMTLRLTDGSTTVAAIVRGYSEHERTEGEKLLSLLVGVGVLDIQGRPVARYLHTATKKGVEPGGDLDPRDMLKLVTDGGYRSYPAMGRLPVLAEIPEELASFFALTRRRRSRRDYSGGAILRSALDAVLTTGCGITGTLEWAGRKVDLRAYPSSGGLYSVEVYPVVLSVRGLACGLYHYSAGASLLEVLDTTIGVEELMAASLPSERDMVRGGAVLFCLTANFSRHERKYGPGGYRMLVAEAGHLSQNLVLAATALGLDARPFGGVYDDLLNRVLGLRSDNEQFLLGVLIGHAG